MSVFIVIFAWFILSNLAANKLFKLIFNYDRREPHEQHILDTAIGYKIDRAALTLLIFLSTIIIYETIKNNYL